MKRSAVTTALLLLLALPALAQVQQSVGLPAIGPTITLIPWDRFSSDFTTGSLIRASGRIFALELTSFTLYRFTITTVPHGARLNLVQGETNGSGMMTAIVFALSADMTGVTGIRIVGPGLDEVIPLIGAATPAPAKPQLTTRGRYVSFQQPAGVDFDGTITFVQGEGVLFVALFAQNLGVVTGWQMEIADTGGNLIVMPARAHALSQIHPELIDFSLPKLPVGTYFWQAVAPGVGAVSNVVQIVIQ